MDPFTNEVLNASVAAPLKHLSEIENATIELSAPCNKSCLKYYTCDIFSTFFMF